MLLWKNVFFALYICHLSKKGETLSDEKTKLHLPLVLSSKDIFNPTSSMYFLLVYCNKMTFLFLRPYSVPKFYVPKYSYFYNNNKNLKITSLRFLTVVNTLMSENSVRNKFRFSMRTVPRTNFTEKMATTFKNSLCLWGKGNSCEVLVGKPEGVIWETYEKLL
jgi:hypothetical protein